MILDSVKRVVIFFFLKSNCNRMEYVNRMFKYWHLIIQKDQDSGCMIKMHLNS